MIHKYDINEIIDSADMYFYVAEEVDSIIAKLEAENERLNIHLKAYLAQVEELKKE